MTIKAIEARFTSGNDIPVQKAMVPADEWKAVVSDIKLLESCVAISQQTCKGLHDLVEISSLENEALREEVERLQQANRYLLDWFEAAKTDAQRWAFIEVAATPIVSRVATLTTNQRSDYVDACIKESK